MIFQVVDNELLEESQHPSLNSGLNGQGDITTHYPPFHPPTQPPIDQPHPCSEALLPLITHPPQFKVQEFSEDFRFKFRLFDRTFKFYCKLRGLKSDTLSKVTKDINGPYIYNMQCLHRNILLIRFT